MTMSKKTGRFRREKGKRGERDLAKKLSALFNVVARRGKQYKGTEDSPDVVAFDGLHIECKRTERFNVYATMKQASEDSGDNIPIVLHKRNYKPWLFVVQLEDLPETVRLLNKYLC